MANKYFIYGNLAIFLPNIVRRVMMAKNIFKIKQGGDINYIFLPNIVRRVMMAKNIFKIKQGGDINYIFRWMIKNDGDSDGEYIFAKTKHK